MSKNSTHELTAARGGRGQAGRGWLAALLALFATAAGAQGTTLYEEEFDAGTQSDRWALTGDWRFRENSPCLPNEVGYQSPFTALVFDYGTSCSYGNSRTGYATMTQDVFLPITNPTVSLEYSDFVGAELGADFYTVELSTDGGQTWPHTLLLDSADESFWDRESIDLSPFIGQSIRVRFCFASDASITGLGWYVDDVEIVAESLPDGVSAVALGDAQIVEGDSGTATLNFPVTIAPANPSPITISFATQSGTAQAGPDFVASSGPLTIPANQTSVNIPVQVRGDTLTEQTENFTVVLSSPSSNAVITLNTGQGTILDNETQVCTDFPFDLTTSSFAWSTGFPPDPPLDAATNGLWHIQASSGCIPGTDGYVSSPNALVFNNEGTCTYDTPGGVSGSARFVSPFPIPDSTSLTAELRFKHFLEIAYNAVQEQVTTAYVEVSTDTLNWTTIKKYAPTTPSSTNYLIPWGDEVISLNQFVGQSVFVRFRFVQPNEVNPNNAVGWYVDDVKICIGQRPSSVSKVRVSDKTESEGNAGSKTMSFPVSISPANPDPITLSYRTLSLTGADAATPEVDYSSESTQKVIPANSTSTTLDVTVLGDDEPGEGNEQFEIEIAGVSTNVFLVNDTATGTIQDDDTPSTFSVKVAGSDPASTTVSEDAGTVTFEVTISPTRTVPISINYSTVNGSALAGAGLDYEFASGQLDFPANTATASFSVTLLDDAQFEDTDDINPGNDPEEFFIKLISTSPFAAGGAPVSITLEDDETAPPGGVSKLFISDTVSATEGSCPGVSASEPCGELNDATFTITLDVANAADISVDYTTVAQSAQAGTDYVETSGTVTVPSGATSVSFTVPLRADRAIEGDESFLVELSNPQGNVNVKSNTSLCTIRDDDFAGVAFGVDDKVYKRPLATVDSTAYNNVALSGGPAQTSGIDFKGFEFDKLYGVTGTNMNIVDLVLNSVVSIATSGGSYGVGEVLTGIAWDHTNGTAYVSSNQGRLFTLDVTSGAVVEVGSLPGVELVALAVHPTSGRIYAFSIEAGTAKLYRVIPGSWVFTLVGTLSDTVPGTASEDPKWAADFDDASFELYLNAYVSGNVWVTKVVDIDDAETRTVVQPPFGSLRPLVSSLAIASSPTPPAVDWTDDLTYESAAPTGYELDGGTALAGTQHGTVVSALGDVNGDTFDDFAVAVPDADTSAADAGRVYVLYGSPVGGASNIVKNFLNQVVEYPAELSGTTGLVISGVEASERVGTSVAGVGDVNGDGIADFAMGYLSGSNRGGVLLVYGSRSLPAAITSGSIGTSVAGVKMIGKDTNDRAGAVVSGAGDVNSDGLADVIIGAPDAGVGAAVGTGAAYVVFGAKTGLGTNGVLNLASLEAPKGVTVLGEATADGFGTGVSGVGDVNGDGVDDFAITAPGALLGDVGSCYVLYGHIDYGVTTDLSIIALARLTQPTPAQITPGSPPNLSFTSTIPDKEELANFVSPTLPQPGMPGVLPGMRITGQGGNFGRSVRGIGDFNGDAIGDFVVSAPDYDGSAAPEAHWGRAYVLLGREENVPETAAANMGTTVPALVLNGIDDGDGIGAVSGAGDVNGDGLMDLLIGAKDASPGGFDGEAYLVYGRAGLAGTLSLRDLSNAEEGDALGRYLYNTKGGAGYNFGQVTATTGDFNDDGVSDFVVGRENGALVILGDTELDQVTYRNRMRSGKSNLDVPGSDTTDLGSSVKASPGMLGDGSVSRPMGRVSISFKGGGTGNQEAEPSTQDVTLYRYASPDLAVGEGNEEDDARWVPGNVFWKVQTDRQNFTESTLEFFYRPEEVAGFNLQKVRMYYAKPNAELNDTTSWTLLPLTTDPLRGALIVKRDHTTATAQAEFNGYYALVQADFVVDLGKVIPPVGITSDQVLASGPTVVPANFTFWHDATKRLYAVAPGPITVTWYNKNNEKVSTVDVLNKWPNDTSKFQTYIVGSPPVKMEETSGQLRMLSHSLVAKDPVIQKASPTSLTPEQELTNNKQFNVSLSLTSDPAVTVATDDPSVTGRALVLLSDNANPRQGNIFFQFVRVKKWNNTENVAALKNHPIGTFLGASTDPTFATKHDEQAGSPYLLFGNTPYAPSSTRYPGFYNRDTRTGTIVFVNEVTGTLVNPVVVYYQRGQNLLDARTSGTVRENNQPLLAFNWPHFAGRYAPVWPTATADNTIVIARQDGSKEIAPATFGTEIDVYVQNTSGATGFNPNEEHALIRPYGSGQAVFALRDDLNDATSGSTKPWVLMTYNDPNDLDASGNPRAKMRAFFVKQTEGVFVFGDWAGISGTSDPYEGEAGSLVLPPYPLSTLKASSENKSDDKVAWKDRNQSIWATAQGTVKARYFYPVQPDFFFPASYKSKHPTRNFAVNGSDVPFLDGGATVSSQQPKQVQYKVVWPTDVPTMGIGEILLEARNGLPQINGQCSVDMVFEETQDTVQLIDPVQARSVALAEIPLGIETALSGSDITFPGLPPALNFRISYNQSDKRLVCKGVIVDPVLGFDYPLLNVLSAADKTALLALSTDAAWVTAVNALYTATQNVVVITDSANQNYDALGLSTGNAKGLGYVTLAFQNAGVCAPLPVSVEVIKVVNTVNPGDIAVVKPPCVFEERLGLMQTIDFAGKPENFEFEWLTRPDEDGTIPPGPDNLPDDNTDGWFRPDLGLNNPNKGVGLSQITIAGPGLLTLTDNWFVCRYKQKDGAAPYGAAYSNWTTPQLAPGWIKRVVGQINPFTQRAGGGGIAGAEQQFAAFSENAPNVIGNMLSLAGPRFTGSVPLNCENLDGFGLIPIYSTVLNRGATLSIDALSPINNPNVNNALILAASRINELYTLLGNEAYADAADPTVAFATDDGEYGAQATSIHPFMNQTSSLIEEELALLRGRDATYAPGTQVFPVYNRLVWNFTKDSTGGEVAYALNYNLADAVSGGDGVISEADARDAFPQGHGDAWGHYLTAMTTYYRLLRHPFFGWTNRSEGYLVGGKPVTVDYLDERKFAKSAAAKARTGAEIVNLTYRQGYVEDPSQQWQALKDSDANRAWGFSEWAVRAGQGAYVDWLVGNAILPAVDPDPGATGVTKIDRTTVPDLEEIRLSYDKVQQQADTADLGLNPLGLGTNVIPFDISPADIDDGLTHFEQIYGRALGAIGNAVTAFDNAAGTTQLLRRQADTQLQFERSVQDQEIDFKSRLIELFGTPYPEDMGPGGTYPAGYDGADIFHYMYVDDSPIYRDNQLNNVYFAPGSTPANAQNVPSQAEALAASYASAQNVNLGSGGITIGVNLKNYGSLWDSDGVETVSDGQIQTRPLSVSATNVISAQPVRVNYNLGINRTGGMGIVKPSAWTGKRATTGQIQQANAEVVAAMAGLASAVKDYENFVADIETDTQLLEKQFNIARSRLSLKNSRYSQKTIFQDALFGLKTTQIVLRTAVGVAEKIAEATAESIPTVTGIIIGFSNGIIIDGLAPARGGLKGVGYAIAETLKVAADLIDIANLRLELEDNMADVRLEIDEAELDAQEAAYAAVKEIERKVRGEFTQRLAVYTAYEAMTAAIANYGNAVGEAQRTLEQLDIFRKRTSADVQALRYKDMAFRIFRNDQLQKYRAQYDLAARYTYLAAKAYDYETTMLSSDQRAGERFLTNIVRARQLGTVTDGEPQPGVGLADSLAIMSRNFGVLAGQLGFNNPQVETNRFSLRYEKFRLLVGPDGDEEWRDVLNQDYFADGMGRVDNLWDVPEFAQYCVPPADFGAVEPGIIIPFATTIKEGKNFFGEEAGGFDNSYDSTQFATKIRSVGVWFSNYDFFNLSNTPRVYLVPAGTDVLRSPTGFAGTQRYFKVVDQILPVPYPITLDELDRPDWIPSVDSLDGQFNSIRRFGRLRAYHDSGEFSEDEVNRDSRLIGRSVWNSRWMLIIPGSTLSSDAEEGIEYFINGRDVNGVRDGNGVKDIKIFFETYAFPRLKSGEAKEAGAAEVVVQPQ